MGPFIVKHYGVFSVAMWLLGCWAVSVVVRAAMWNFSGC